MRHIRSVSYYGRTDEQEMIESVDEEVGPTTKEVAKRKRRKSRTFGLN